MQLSERQRREIEYHRRRAAEHRAKLSQPVTLTQFASGRHRWWNAYWHLLLKARRLGLVNNKVLVVGSGFGEDAITLSLFAQRNLIYAFDLSEESTRIAKRRAQISGASVCYVVAAAESLPFSDNHFDIVYLSDVVHHVDIPIAMGEISRVLKPGGWILGNEPYTHSRMQKIRNSHIVQNILYPKMRKWVYGNDTPYITQDERKLDETDMYNIQQLFQNMNKTYFSLVSGRLFTSNLIIEKLETLILRAPMIGHFFGGRVVYSASNT